MPVSSMRIVRLILNPAPYLMAMTLMLLPVHATQAAAGSLAPPNGGWGVAWAPDGSQVAFLSATPHMPPNVWIMNRDGSGARQLTRGGAGSVEWTEDGSALRFSTERAGFQEVFRVDVSGKREERVPGLPPKAGLPTFSPDGELFAFIAPDSTNIRSLWVGTRDRSRVERVTALLSVRSFFWSTDSRSIFFEAGKTYGIGIWALDLATMKTSALVNKYVGKPALSPAGDLIAYPYPSNPGEYEVRTIACDGTGEEVYPAPRMTQRWLAWDPAGKAIYYLGQELDTAGSPAEPVDPATQMEKPESLHPKREEPAISRSGEIALWRLDLDTGVEERVSPVGLHLGGFAVSPVGGSILLEGVEPSSFASEIFRFDPGSGELARLTATRPSFWMPTPSRDSRRIAFLTNRSGADEILVADLQGKVVRDFPGLVAAPGTRLQWLPESDALFVTSGTGVVVLTADGTIPFPDAESHRRILYADASVVSDKVLLDAIPRFGEVPNLYELEVEDGAIVQHDMRNPPPGEIGVEIYMQPHWSFDESMITFTDRVDVWVMKADGSGRRWITNYDKQNAIGKSSPTLASHPVWSVRGDRVCYTASVYSPDEITREIWVTDPEGKSRKKIFSEPVNTTFQLHQEDYTSRPFFDETDDRVILTAQHDGMPNIAAISVHSGKVEWLTREGAVFPQLLPDEGLIVYTSLAGNRELLRIMGSDGEGDRALVIQDGVPTASAEAGVGSR